MITENAIVVSIENNQTWIETQRKSACGQCSANKGCGTSVLSKVIGNKLSKIKAINNINAQVGDEVVIGLNEQSLLKGAFMIYMLPLILLFLFSIVGQLISANLQIHNSELLVIVFAIAGFYIGMRKVKSFSSSIAQNEDYQPVILKKLNSSVLVNL
ncbi:MAG: SoxR reducing system RseC family protein [Gammaproteobacteria bacterium]|nr:SoxR reducing system RseC family protein [Gammaproteobacteria bacterium]MCW8987544.1 SoxR reducing system RseC family protein [Gammaproteobacteria bacterium]MCW9029874.1 SoxR reducing system RseC family protein [Gammaproteobacteria bacterium]